MASTVYVETVESDGGGCAQIPPSPSDSGSDVAHEAETFDRSTPTPVIGGDGDDDDDNDDDGDNDDEDEVSSRRKDDFPHDVVADGDS